MPTPAVANKTSAIAIIQNDRDRSASRSSRPGTAKSAGLRLRPASTACASGRVRTNAASSGITINDDRDSHRKVSRAKSVMLHHVVREDRYPGAAQRDSRERNPKRQPAIRLKPVGDYKRRRNDRRGSDPHPKQDKDHKKFSRRIRTAECDETQRHHRRARDHHLARADSIHQPSNCRTAQTRGQRRDADQQREKSAAPSEVLDYREEEHTAGVDRSPDQEHGREQRGDDRPSLVFPARSFE